MPMKNTDRSDAVTPVRTAAERFRSPHVLANLPPESPCLVAFSGGADSRLLLHLLAEEAKETGARLLPVHIHHGIRGAEADRDADFCRAVAASYGLDIRIVRLDVPAMARACGESLETVARRARYDCFADLMRRENIPLLATAHHADDNAETVLFRLARGTGLRGLCGIAPCRPFEAFDGSFLSRPLLALTKQDILDACRAAGLDFVTDSTNASAVCARNRLRLSVLPVLRQVSAHPEEQILRTCRGLREDEEFLRSLAKELLQRARMEESRSAALSLPVLTAAPVPLAKRALTAAAEDAGLPSPEARHLERLLAFCRRAPSARRLLSLPGGYAVTERGTLTFYKSPAESLSPGNRPQVRGETAGTLPEIPFGDGNLRRFDLPFTTTCREIRETDTLPSKDRENIYKPFIHDTLTFATITPYENTAAWHWRSRRPGDTLLRHGVSRKVRKLQNEAGIPLALRGTLPLLCDADDHVLWVPFVGARDGFARDPDQTCPCLLLTLSVSPRAL